MNELIQKVDDLMSGVLLDKHLLDQMTALIVTYNIPFDINSSAVIDMRNC